MIQCLEGKAGQSPPGGLARKTPSRWRGGGAEGGRLQAGGGSEDDTVADRDQTGSNLEC